MEGTGRGGNRALIPNGFSQVLRLSSESIPFLTKASLLLTKVQIVSFLKSKPISRCSVNIC